MDQERIGETVSRMFGQRILPPAEAMPPQVADSVAAWREACERSAEARAALGAHRRIGIASARGKDVEEHARALEQQTAPPKGGKHEGRAIQKLSELERGLAACELVEQRAYARMNQRIEEHSGEVVQLSERRAAAAKRDYLAALDDLAAAVEELREAYALKTWSSDPSTSYKARGLSVPLARHADSEPSIEAILDALREALEPRRRPTLPSPFGVAPQPEPEPEASPEPSDAERMRAELAAGMVGNVSED
jgi:hypothetical protein